MLCLSVASLTLLLRPLHFAVRTTVTRAELVDEESKTFHAIGYNIGSGLGDLEGFGEEAVDSIVGGIKQALMGESFVGPLAEYTAKADTMLYMRAAEKEETFATLGKEALEKAAAEEGAITTKSGLVFLSLKEGSGGSPSPTDAVEVHAEGMTVDGTVFDSSYQKGETLSFPLYGVMPGWSEGLMLMKVGGKAKVTIPYALAYGDFGDGNLSIPPRSTLVFTLELLAINCNSLLECAVVDVVDDDE